MKLIDLAGQQVGRLSVISRAPNNGRRAMWLCLCACGTKTVINGEALRYGRTKSCGCLRKEATAHRSITHGHCRGRKSTRTLKSYQHAKSRCTNPEDPKYPDYGGRGIIFYLRWAESFESFLEDMGECPEGMTIDRINNDGHYEPGNCKWSTPYQQSRNTRQNIWVKYKGTVMCLKDYARVSGQNYKNLHAKVSKGRFRDKFAMLLNR